MKQRYLVSNGRWVTPFKSFDNSHTLVLDKQKQSSLVAYKAANEDLLTVPQFMRFKLMNGKFPAVQAYLLLFCLWIFSIQLTSNPTLVYETSSKEIKSFYEMTSIRKEVIKQKDFSISLFLEYVKLSSVPNSEIVVNQAILETSMFQSDIFNENQNLFGMKFPLVRETTAQAVNRGHATYNHWTDSVDDYVLWYQYMTKERHYTDYYAFLVHIGYAEDPAYINKLKNL